MSRSDQNILVCGLKLERGKKIDICKNLIKLINNKIF